MTRRHGGIGRRMWTPRCGGPGARRRGWDIIASPYRRLVRPLVDYVNRLKGDLPTRLIAVIIPELAEKR